MGGKWQRRFCAAAAGSAVWAAFVGPARSEQIVFEPDFGHPPMTVDPGDQVIIRIRLYENVIPITGYSLNVDAVPSGGTTGLMLGNADLSNFYDVDNVITQGGGELHPVSDIFDPGDGGLFVNALAADFMPVDLAGEGHDALAELIFDVSLDAGGEFNLEFGFGTILTDEGFEAIPFTWDPITVFVVPEPTGLALSAVVLTAVTLGRPGKPRSRRPLAA